MQVILYNNPIVIFGVLTDAVQAIFFNNICGKYLYKKVPVNAENL